MSKAFAVCILVMLLVSAVALADEFSGNEMDVGWRVIGSEKARVNHVNGVVGLVVPKNERMFFLRAQLKGDWQIDTQIQVPDTVGRVGEYFHGLTLYADESNYLVFGKTANAVALKVSIDGQEEIVLTCPDDDFVKIRKVTRGGAACYFFYSNDVISGVHTWLYRGCYADTDGVFDDASYGFFAAGSKRCSAVYDYFTEGVPDMEVSVFPDMGAVDGVWQIENERALVASANGALRVTYRNDGVIAAALRPPIAEDYRVQIHVDNLSASHGLMIFLDDMSYLLLTPVGAYACDAGYSKRLCELPGANAWLRITKQGDVYALDTSGDGATYVRAAEYTNAALADAAYGVGALDAKYVTASYSFITESKAPNGMIADVSEYKEIGRMIGAKEDRTLNDTYAMANLRSGDLGNLVDAGDHVYMMLGDSFSGDGTGSGSWRSNVLCIIDDDTPEDGLHITRVISDERGMMKELVTARHVDYDEVTCIPMHGVFIDGVLYYQYMSVYHWGVPAHWDSNASGIAWSGDGGNTWEKKEGLFDGHSGFVMCALLRKDGYVYFYGIPTAKFGSIRLARVPEYSLLDRAAYTFYAGDDDNGKPLWTDDEASAVPIVSDHVSELSVVYNQALDRYLLAYMNESTLNMVLRDSPTPWGPWSHPIILTDHLTQGFRYAPYMLEKYIQQDGTRLYFMATNSARYYTTWNSVRLIINAHEE